MQNSDTYKGFVYQKKCAFLLLLHELAARTGVIAFRMEHPKGDDFDLVYPAKLKIFQTKDVQAPNFGEYLGKMWRRYTENILPGESRSISLGFIFSKEHSSNACFAALKDSKVKDTALTGLFSDINNDRLAQVKIANVKEWQSFLKPITVQVLAVDEIERELKRSLGLIFFVYQLPEHEIESVSAEFLGRLDEIMQNGREVREKEVRELINQWFARYCNSHPIMRNYTRASLAASLAQLDDNETSIPSPTKSGTI